MKRIVTHFYPDVDAISSAWLVKTFYPGWEEADIAFVAAGETLEGKPVDSDPEIIHVDTGMGLFDHHQTYEKTCAAKLVFEFLRELKTKYQGPRTKKNKKTLKIWHEEALERMINVVVDIDHFGNVFWPDSTSDVYDFSFESIIDGWKLLSTALSSHRDITEWGMKILDGIYRSFINKIEAEKELKRHAIPFQSPWGRAIAIETSNDDVLTLAQKQGITLTLRKDPRKGFVRIKARPGSNVDLTETYERLKVADAKASWFLHASKLMVLNGSSKNPKMKATMLTLDEIVTILSNPHVSK